MSERELENKVSEGLKLTHRRLVEEVSTHQYTAHLQ